jgi:flagellar protein FlaG
MDFESNINSINTKVNLNQNLNQSDSVKNQKEIAKEDDVNHISDKKKLEGKKQDLSSIVKEKDFNETIDSVNQYVEMFNNKVSFTIDNKSREIIHVYDNETGDLIRQIPPKEMIELVDKLEEVAGIIFNNKV